MSNKKQQTTKFITKDILKSFIMGAFQKLDPGCMSKNPIMFMVEIGFFITLLLCFIPNMSGDVDATEDRFSMASLRVYNVIVTIIFSIIVLSANFAESVAGGREKAQAETLKKTKEDTIAHLLTPNGSGTNIPASELKRGDVVMVRMNELIPNNDEVIEETASVDESTITGESAPVARKAGGDFSSMTGGMTAVSDWLKIKIAAEPGSSFLGKMIALVEGASRRKTPNEITLDTSLVGLTIIFLIVIVCLYPFAVYSEVQIPVAILIAPTVYLIPTTIGGLLSAIGIASMDHITRFSVITVSGKAVEACSDVDTMILGKTDTITFGSRLAADFRPMARADQRELIDLAVLSSLEDTTLEGKSIVELGKKMGSRIDPSVERNIDFTEFTTQSKMSGADLEGSARIRKGAGEAIKAFVNAHGGKLPEDSDMIVEEISKLGGTPFTVCRDNHILGVIHLKGTVKPGLVKRFTRLREIDIKTIVCTDDNPLTVATIVEEAGVDGFIAECKPEDKVTEIKEEQAEGRIVTMTGDGTNDAPTLAQADVGFVTNSGTQAVKEAASMVDLSSDPTKILEVMKIGKQLLITGGSLTTFSITNDVAKHFTIMPTMFMLVIPQVNMLDIMRLTTPYSTILSALIFSVIIIPSLIPIAMHGVKYKPMRSDKMLLKNMEIYGMSGMIMPFIGIKIIDVMVSPLLALLGLQSQGE